MSDAIRINNIRFKYRGQSETAVSNISIAMAAGKITGLLGPNGAGKTTLIHLICGLLTPEHGHIEFSGQERNSSNCIKSTIGFVPQQDGLFGEMTLRENLNYFGRLYKLHNEAIHAGIDLYADWLQLKGHLGKKIKHFSGGMNRRANIVAALLHRPKIIILDEPTSGVDIQSRALIHEVISTLQKEGNTILYTSHLIAEAELLCDDIIVIDGGKVLVQGSTDQLKKERDGNSLENYLLELTGKEVRD